MPSRQQPAVVLELKERLFGCNKCHIIELGAPPVFLHFLPGLTLCFDCCMNCTLRVGAGTGIVSLVLAALLSVTSSASHAESCLLSTDLREFVTFEAVGRPAGNYGPFTFFLFVASSMELMYHNIRTNAVLYPDCSPTALPLDWDEELPEMVQDVRERGGFDLIV